MPYVYVVCVYVCMYVCAGLFAASRHIKIAYINLIKLNWIMLTETS